LRQLMVRTLQADSAVPVKTERASKKS